MPDATVKCTSAGRLQATARGLLNETPERLGDLLSRVGKNVREDLEREMVRRSVELGIPMVHPVMPAAPYQPPGRMCGLRQ